MPKQQQQYRFHLEDVHTALIEKYGANHVTVGEGYVKAPCLCHDDEEPSMSVSQKEGRVLVKCFAGCEQDDLWAAVMRLMNGHTPASADFNPSRECTLSAYAEAKRLDAEWLQQTFGLADAKYQGHRRLVIPYGDDSIRYRTALTGKADRFRWKTGAHPRLYGLFGMDDLKKEDEVLLVEGESDVHTAWFHGFPALGVPGATSFKDDRDAPRLESFERVYLLVEPDQGGAVLADRLAKSAVRDRLHFVTLGDFKDLSEMHVDAPDKFEDRLNAALSSAVSWTEFQDRGRRATERDAWEQCSELAQSEHILDAFREDLQRCGLVGEDEVACVLYLALTSRVFSRPVSVIVKGPSSGGKSHTVTVTLQFMPMSAYYTMSAMSEKALIYWEEPLVHRHLVLYEAAGINSDFLAYAIRSLLSEGTLRYTTVESTPEGIMPREIVREGPTGLFLTTTRVAINPENETRMISLTVKDTPEQTKAVLKAIARGTPDEVDYTRWHALQEWVGSRPTEVVVPFAEPLADLIPPVATRLRRDFTTLLMLIRAHALLHHFPAHWDPKLRIPRGQVVAAASIVSPKY